LGTALTKSAWFYLHGLYIWGGCIAPPSSCSRGPPPALMSQPTARPAGGRRPQQRHAANHATPVAQQPRDAASVQSRAAAHDPAAASPVLSVALPALLSREQSPNTTLQLFIFHIRYWLLLLRPKL
jgi:hypothetical protein